MRSRPLVLCLAAVLILLCARTIVSGQDAPARTEGVNPADPRGILHQLAPDDVAPPFLGLKPAGKARAIQLLMAVKRDETGWHKQLAIYCLASLDHEYEHNREELVRVWRRDGDDGTMALLISLYRQGHKELLQPLLARYDGWNAAASEGLGTFFSEELTTNPSGFLAVLATFSPQRQHYLCTAAGGTDGGGMGPKTERRVLANLKVIGGEIADRCARGVRIGNQEADEANHDLPGQPLKKQ